MGENTRAYPLKSLHDFLSELDDEWDRFRRASLMGTVTSGVLLVFLLLRISAFLALLGRPRIELFDILYDVLFLVLVAVFVIYEISLLIAQYGFFRKWERRIGLLLHLERRLMSKHQA